jgi:hypothetical protein
LGLNVTDQPGRLDNDAFSIPDVPGKEHEVPSLCGCGVNVEETHQNRRMRT